MEELSEALCFYDKIYDFLFKKYDRTTINVQPLKIILTLTNNLCIQCGTFKTGVRRIYHFRRDEFHRNMKLIEPSEAKQYT